MEKINNTLVVASAILNINKEVIRFDEIFEYQKDLSQKLKGTKYVVNKITSEDIINFCKKYCVFIKNHNRESLVLKNLNILKEKFDKYFCGSIEPELYDYIKYKPKYIIPIIEDDKYLEYNFVPSNLNYFEKLRDRFIFMDGKYIIDFKSLVGIIYTKENNKFLYEIINDSEIQPNITFDYNNMLKIFYAVNILLNEKNKDLYLRYGILDDITKLGNNCHNLFDIFFIAKTNSLILQQNGINISNMVNYSDKIK